MVKPIGLLSRQDEDAIWAKAKSLPLPRYLVVPSISAFLLWGRSSGWEFAINRFKTMKTNLARIAAGLEPIWGIGEYPTKGIPWFKGLVTLSKKGDRELSLCLSLLNVYTYLTFSEITAKQESKFLDGVLAEPVKISNKFKASLLDAASQLPRPNPVQEPKWLLDKAWSPSKRTPSVSVGEDGYLNYYVTKPEQGGVLDSVLALIAGVDGHELLDLLAEVPSFGTVLGGLDLFSGESLVEKLGSKKHDKIGLLGGTVSFIQEAGGKLRSVANPYRWWQAALEPLAVSIHELLKEIDYDCTFNQNKGLHRIQESLAAGDEWFSVDISSATDHFPLAYQIPVLEFVFQDDPLARELIRLFHAVSRMPWWYRDREGKLKNITWRKGQPMGLRPSFGSFALTHGLVLLALNQGVWKEDFWLLGDDVVIRGKELHQKYRWFLKKHEIPVSESKTLRGGIAEFASKLITPSTIVPIYKWRKSDKDNFVDLARLWGPESLGLFPKEQQRVLTKLANVPDVFGGLGWGDPALWDYSVPKWIGTRVGQLHDPSGMRAYMKNVYTSTVVSQTGVVPKPGVITGQESQLEELVYRVTGLLVTNNRSFTVSMASNIVEMLDVHIPYAQDDGKPLSKLDLWKHRLGLD